MFRHSAATLLLASSLSLSYRKTACQQSDPKWSFDTKGLPTKTTPNLPGAAHTSPLLLSGVGMRRKNFYIVEVDVYLIGLYLSSNELSKGKDWSQSSEVAGSLSDALLERKLVIGQSKDKKASPKHNDVKIALTLKFVRGVTKSQFIDAFNEAFIGCKPEYIETFKASLGQVVDDSGVKQGEEIHFYWLENGDFTVSRDGKVGNTFNIDEINHRLLEVYIDPKRTVSPQLSESIHNFLKSVEF